MVQKKKQLILMVVSVLILLGAGSCKTCKCPAYSGIPEKYPLNSEENLVQINKTKNS